MSRILVIDDDASFADLTKRRLEKHGMHVTTNSEPSSVIPLLASGKFDLLLLDLSMPGLSGDNLLGVLRNLPDLDSMKVLIHSSIDEERMRKVAAKHDAAFLSKSASVDELVAEITKLLGA